MARGKGNKRGGSRGYGKRFDAFSAEEIEQRNQKIASFDERRAKHRAEHCEDEMDDGEDSNDFERVAENVGKRVASMNIGGSKEGGEGNPNHVVDPEQQHMSRKQREEAERAAKAAHYRKLHETGLTDEYKRDMEKLAEVKKRREVAAKRAQEEKEAMDLQEEERKKKAAEAGATNEEKDSKKKKKKKEGKVDIPKLDKIVIKKMKPTQLKEAMKERGLDIQGNAKTLTARLLDYEKNR